MIKELFLHFNYTRTLPHTAKITKTFIESNHLVSTPHPPYSPDIAPSAFFLFRDVKGKLKGQEFTSAGGPISAIIEIFNEYFQEFLNTVFDELMKRLLSVFDSKGKYIA